MNKHEFEFIELIGTIQFRTTRLNLYELGEILSEKVFGGIKFGNEDKYLREEYPALELFPYFLNFQVILTDCLEDNLFHLSIERSPKRSEYFSQQNLRNSINFDYFLFHTINSLLYDYESIEVIELSY